MNYNILKELGHGGMATVYLAQDKKFDTEVAIKFLNKEFINNENIRKRFIAEAKNMYKMSHPNIIKVTDLIDEGDTVAFVMEHVDGETLKEYLDRKGKLSDEEIRNIFSQMLDAVGYVHEQGLVHRDIKPSNFMIDKKGKVKLLDFGIAKNTDVTSAEYTQTGTGMQMGTPMYMSPEQITETKSVTAQSDIYSLGVVLWQLVTGERPYNTATLSNFQLQLKIVNEPLAFTGSAFDAIIKKATEKDETNRYSNATAFLSAMLYRQEQFENTVVKTNEEKTVIANQDKTFFVEKAEPQKEMFSTVDKKDNEKTIVSNLNYSKTTEPSDQKSEKLQRISFLGSYSYAIKNYFIFEGRTSFRVYWNFVAINFLISFIPIVGIVHLVFTLIPSLSMAVRRVHDVGKSGWYLLIPVYSLILVLSKGQNDKNKYGVKQEN
jgi:serine/threonine protein kinase